MKTVIYTIVYTKHFTYCTMCALYKVSLLVHIIEYVHYTVYTVHCLVSLLADVVEYIVGQVEVLEVFGADKDLGSGWPVNTGSVLTVY